MTEGTKAALLLRVGDVITAPDGSRHTVTSHHQVDGISVTFTTDTGHRFHKSWYEALADTYDCDSGECKP